MGGDGTWTGGWAFEGLEFDARKGYRSESGYRPVMEGSGQRDRIVFVGECDVPALPGNFACHVNGEGRVVFARR